MHSTAITCQAYRRQSLAQHALHFDRAARRGHAINQEMGMAAALLGQLFYRLTAIGSDEGCPQRTPRQVGQPLERFGQLRHGHWVNGWRPGHRRQAMLRHLLSSPHE